MEVLGLDDAVPGGGVFGYGAARALNLLVAPAVHAASAGLNEGTPMELTRRGSLISQFWREEQKTLSRATTKGMMAVR